MTILCINHVFMFIRFSIAHYVIPLLSLSLTHLGVRRCTLGFSGELRQLVLASSVHETAEVGGQEASGEFVLLGIVVVEVCGKKVALVR